MGSLGVSVFFLVMIVNFQIIVSKPLFGDLFCDLFCDDDDVTSTSTSTSASTEDDYFGFGDWCSCGPTTRRPNARGQGFPAINMVLPPSNGMNLRMGNNNGVWTFDLNAVPNGPGNPAGNNTVGNNPAGNNPPGNNPGMGPFFTTAAPTTAGSTPAATTAAG